MEFLDSPARVVTTALLGTSVKIAIEKIQIVSASPSLFDLQSRMWSVNCVSNHLLRKRFKSCPRRVLESVDKAATVCRKKMFICVEQIRVKIQVIGFRSLGNTF